MALLAHLYSHIRGSQEDIATYSLQYILSASSELNRAFTHLVSESFHCEVLAPLNYICQVSGENRERPDMVGVDIEGNEQILCEAKFYAGLTNNQPNSYLDRIAQRGGTGLVFICPEVRKAVLWDQLKQLVAERNTMPISDFCLSVDGVKMAIITWNEVTSILKRTSASTAIEYVSDVEQLEGFCKQMDSDAFIPFSAEDLGPEVPRKEERYYRVIDKLVEYLKTDKSLNPITKGVKATAYRKGYGRGINIRGYWLSINYDRDLWTDASSCETPFWVAVRSGKDWKQHDYIIRALNRFPEIEKGSIWGLTYIALHPMLNGTLDEIVADMKAQLMKFVDAADEELAAETIEA